MATQSASTVSGGSSCSRSEADIGSESLHRSSSDVTDRASAPLVSPRLRVGNTTPRGTTRAGTPRATARQTSPRGTPRQTTPRGTRREGNNEGGSRIRQTTPRGHRRDANGEEGVRDEVKVVVRVRPPLEKGPALSYFADENDQTKLVSTSLEGGGVSGTTSTSSGSVPVEEFGFSRVISPNEDNRKTFEALGLRELISGVSQGFQETIFAYGQTGSGKTHTILGSARDNRRGEPGLLQLCTQELFNTVFNCDSGTETRRCIQLICLEIKNEEIIDLLHTTGSTQRGGASASNSTPRSTSAAGTSTPRHHGGTVQATQENLSIKGKRISYKKVTTWSYEETMWLLREAVASREVGTSLVNHESSRSHMVVRFFVKTLSIPENPDAAAAPGATTRSSVVGCLTLVDLAGNEREEYNTCGTLGVNYNHLANATRKGEAKAINVSLTHLNRMLLKMQNGQLDESDRRQGTLNMILYDSLREDCGTTMIFCIHPDRRFALSARSTLQMALRCRRIVRQKKVRHVDPAGDNDELVNLRVAASALSSAHKQALEDRLNKDVELQKTAQELHELRQRYEEKERDFDALRSNLESRYDAAASPENCQQQQLTEDLERKDKDMQMMLNQLQNLERQIQERDRLEEKREAEFHELQRRYEEFSSRRVPLAPIDNKENDSTRLNDENTANHQINIDFDKQKVPSIEDRFQELESRYADQFRLMKEAHEQELKNIKDSLKLQELSAEIYCQAHMKRSSTDLLSMEDGALQRQATMSQASPRDSMSGEPCSEPSMQSSGHASEPDEALQQTTPLMAIMQSATPQHRRLSCADEPEAPNHPRESSCKATRWNIHLADQCYMSDKPVEKEAVQAFVKVDKAEKVLRYLQHYLDRDADQADLSVNLVDAQPFESVELYMSQLSRLARQARLEPRYFSQSIDLALKASQHHGSSLKIRRDTAKVLLEIVNKDVKMKENMIAQGAIKLTIDTLYFLLSQYTSSCDLDPQRSASDVCLANFRLLAALFHQGVSKSLAHAALDAVLKCLERRQLREPNCAINGCYLIMTLVDKHAEHKELVRRNNGIDLLLELLDAEVYELENEHMNGSLTETRVVEQASATLCYYIAGCLAKVVQDNERNQEALYEVGGIDLLLRTLKTCMQSGQVVGNACMAIAFIARGHEPSQYAARSQGAIELILDALLAYRGESTVQIGVCRAIATLTEKSPANQKAFLAARLPEGDCQISLLDLLLEAIKSEPLIEPLVTTVCWALSNLMVGNPDAMDGVRLLGGLEIVISLINRFRHEERACEYLCRFFTELVRGDSSAARRNRQDFRSLHAEETITAMASHHVQSDGFVLVRVQDALLNLRG